MENNRINIVNINSSLIELTCIIDDFYNGKHEDTELINWMSNHMIFKLPIENFKDKSIWKHYCFNDNYSIGYSTQSECIKALEKYLIACK